MVLARGAAAAGTGGVGAAGSIGPLSWSAAVASMLVSVSIPVRVGDELCPSGVILCLRLHDLFQFLCVLSSVFTCFSS